MANYANLGPMKYCSGCGEEHPENEFSRNPKTVDNLNIYCDSCVSVMQAMRELCARKINWCMASLSTHRGYGHVVDIDLIRLYALVFAAIDCEYCGTRLNWEKRPSVGHDTPTIDRMDNDFGIVEGNIAVVCHRCNAAKGKQNLEEYRTWILSSSQHLRTGTAAS